MNLRRLSSGERLWLWRQRQPAAPDRRAEGYDARPGRGRAGVGRGGLSMSAGEAAAALGVAPDVYSRAERAGDGAEYLLGLLRDHVSFPTRPEKCTLARRRSGAQVGELCAALGGISPPTFYKRERAAHASVVDLWRARGYRF